MNRLLVTCLVSSSLAALPLVAWADATPDAALGIPGSTEGIGFTETNGMLRCDAHSDPVQMRGSRSVQLGLSSATTRDDVFDLRQLNDINATYTATPARAASAGGATEMTIKNEKGVLIRMYTMNKPVDLRLFGEGASITLSQ